ncbi:MAG: hypothetical protein KAH20_15290 [Methylococcales bacterium]|nr:hypothetical protein [Methylococcales bacterium]
MNNVIRLVLLASVFFINAVFASELISYKSHYQINEPVWIELKNAPHNAEDWIGIYRDGTNTDWANVIAWRWVSENSQTQVDPGVWYKFSDNRLANKQNELPLPVGKYVARFFLNNTYAVENSVSFNIGIDIERKVYPPSTIFDPINEVQVNRPTQKFSSYQDTAFDNEVVRTVTRLTNRENDQKNGNSHPYPKQGTAWNNDMSLLRIDRRIYDAETLREIPLTKGKTGGEVDGIMRRPRSGSSGIRWSKKNSNVLFVMSGNNKFYKLTLSNDRSTLDESVIYYFGDVATVGSFTLGHNEGNIDHNDHFVVLSATKGNKIFAVLLDIQNQRKVGEKKELRYTSGEFDWISVSPSGKYILVTANDNVDLYDANTFQEIQPNFTNRAGHGDIGIDENGDEIYVQLERGGAGIFGYILKNQIRKQLLDSNHGGGHVSCRNYKHLGWCYISTNEKNYRDVFSVRLDGSKEVKRYAQVHQRGSDSHNGQVGNKYYYAENAFVNVSPDGTRVLFWSDYGNPENYLYYDGGTRRSTDHYYNRDTYQVTISR